MSEVIAKKHAVFDMQYISTQISYAQADSSKDFMQSLKSGMNQIFVPKSNENYNKSDIHALSNFQLDTAKFQELPLIQGTDRTHAFSKNQPMFEPVMLLN
ncbi:hypothetical protein [Acinetobacter sp. TSRC1-2]|uniref:hypothetical protein n=1 Tax=unclassified Acinetobacter TaxID=196816 RepID=UPI003CF8CDF6